MAPRRLRELEVARRQVRGRYSGQRGRYRSRRRL